MGWLVTGIEKVVWDCRVVIVLGLWVSLFTGSLLIEVGGFFKDESGTSRARSVG